jgi:ferredoxin
MKAKVKDDCIACELCVETCPEVFEMGDSIAQVKVEVIPAEAEEKAKEAAESCPTDSIVLED